MMGVYPQGLLSGCGRHHAPLSYTLSSLQLAHLSFGVISLFVSHRFQEGLRENCAEPEGSRRAPKATTIEDKDATF